MKRVNESFPPKNPTQISNINLIYERKLSLLNFTCKLDERQVY